MASSSAGPGRGSTLLYENPGMVPEILNCTYLRIIDYYYNR